MNLQATSDPVRYRQTLTLIASVSGGTIRPFVALKTGATLRAMKKLSGGQASFAISNLAVGSHTLVAKYPGDTNEAGANSAPLTINIGKAQQAALTVSAKSTPLTLGILPNFTCGDYPLRTQEYGRDDPPRY